MNINQYCSCKVREYFQLSEIYQADERVGSRLVNVTDIAFTLVLLFLSREPKYALCMCQISYDLALLTSRAPSKMYLLM